MYSSLPYIFHSVSAPENETSGKTKVKRGLGLERSKPLAKKTDKTPTRLKAFTFEPGGAKPTEVPKTRPNHDLKSPNVVLQIVKKSQAPNPPLSKEPESILPSSLKAKSAKTKLKLTKNINNNDVWTNPNEVRSRKKVDTVPIR